LSKLVISLFVFGFSVRWGKWRILSEVEVQWSCGTKLQRGLRQKTRKRTWSMSLETTEKCWIWYILMFLLPREVWVWLLTSLSLPLITPPLTPYLSSPPALTSLWVHFHTPPLFIYLNFAILLQFYQNEFL